MLPAGHVDSASTSMPDVEAGNAAGSVGASSLSVPALQAEVSRVQKQSRYIGIGLLAVLLLAGAVAGVLIGLGASGRASSVDSSAGLDVDASIDASTDASKAAAPPLSPADTPCHLGAGCNPLHPQRDWLDKVVQTQPGGALGPLLGRTLPRTTDALSAAYGIWPGDIPYQEGECPKAIHDLFWVYGPDGKVYPTWHPAIYVNPATGFKCYFGHEHGDSPVGSAFQAEPLPFGYTNEVYDAMVNHGTTQRNEDHVGHKIQWQNNDLDSSKQTSITCNTLIKLHMGTHSKDALSNAMHEFFLRHECSDKRKVNLKVLLSFGLSGEVNVLDQCGTNHGQTIKTFPGISPPNGGLMDGERTLPDNVCVNERIPVPAGQKSSYQDMREHWRLLNSLTNFAGDTKSYFFFNPYLTVLNPSRYLDVTNAHLSATDPNQFLGRFSNLCYDQYAVGGKKGRGLFCDQLLAAQPTWTPTAYQHPHSPWSGTIRTFSPNGVYLCNNNAPDVLTDAIGRLGCTGPNCIKQHLESAKPCVGGYPKVADITNMGIFDYRYDPPRPWYLGAVQDFTQSSPFYQPVPFDYTASDWARIHSPN